MELIVHALVGAALVRLGIWIGKKKSEQPFKWSCFKCDFKVSGTDMDLVEVLRKSHEEVIHGEES